MIVSLIMTAIVLPFGILGVFLAIECFLSLLPLPQQHRNRAARRPRIAVIVPAHNEEQSISRTAAAIAEQLSPSDRLIVVADNCTDSTARVARRAGVIVWERYDEVCRGKGYAIRYALDRLRDDPPQVVVMIDAECHPGSGAIEKLAQQAFQTTRPAQAANFSHSPSLASAALAISSFAVVLKNYVRPRALQRIGAPCLITGTGVAYPWEILELVAHPESHIVEDMRYAVDVTLAGFAPLPCMQASVHSMLPATKEGFVSQRRRWEHGHIGTIISEAPRLAGAFLRTGSLSTLVLLLELMVPPLSLFIVLYAAMGTAAFFVACWSGRIFSFALWATVATLVGTGLALSWWRFGRQVLPATMLWAIPGYVAKKLPIYRNFLSSKQIDWVRTDRAMSATGVVQPPPYIDITRTEHVAPTQSVRS